MDAAHREILARTSEFLGIYFGLPRRALEPEPIDDGWPHCSRRPGVGFGGQLSTRYVLQNLLEPVLPEDAAVLLGLTTWDLWPGEEGWNFVFGQATLHRRVGVWSLRRFGEPGPDRAAWVRCLRRTLKVAAHETVFSIEHSLAYVCIMCGSNSLDETDRHPLHLCPECLPKVWAATGCDPAGRFAALEAFCARHGLDPEADFYRRSGAVLRAP